MSGNYKRASYKLVYGPLADKSLQSVLKRELMEQFGFENMGLIADGLVRRFLEIVREYDPDKTMLLPGQMLWLAVDRNEKCGYGKPMYRCKMVPVVLTVITPTDLRRMADERLSPKDLWAETAVRMLNEANEQGGVLALSDVEVILGMPTHTIWRVIKGYKQAHPDEVLPHRGTVHDMGRTCTHKLQAIQLKLQGLLTQEIARRIHHDPSNVDRYQVDFERTYELYKDGYRPEQISFLCNLSQSLVKEYIKLIEEHVEQTQTDHLSAE